MPIPMIVSFCWVFKCEIYIYPFTDFTVRRLNCHAVLIFHKNLKKNKLDQLLFWMARTTICLIKKNILIPHKHHCDSCKKFFN